MKVEIGRYRTRDGNTAVVTAIDAPGIYPVIGYVVVGAASDACSWTFGGMSYEHGTSVWDLIAPIDNTDDWIRRQYAALIRLKDAALVHCLHILRLTYGIAQERAWDESTPETRRISAIDASAQAAKAIHGQEH